MDPCLISGICKLKDQSLYVQHYWLKYYAFEARHDFVADGTIFHDEDEEAVMDYWGEPLSIFHSNQVLQDKVVNRLLAMAKANE